MISQLLRNTTENSHKLEDTYIFLLSTLCVEQEDTYSKFNIKA